jgi:hypothetical protein
MGAREVSAGVIMFRVGNKLYIVDGTPPANFVAISPGDAASIETKATGGFIKSVFGPARGADGKCLDYSVGTPKAESDRWCKYSTFVSMGIDGPGAPTNKYRVACKAFDRSGKLLAERAGSNTEPGNPDDASVERETPPNAAPRWYGLLRLDAALDQVARVECEARRL